MTATTEFFWPAGIQRPPFRHGLITSNIVSNIVNYSAILLTLLQAILNQVLPPSFSVSTSVVFLTGKTARQPYLAALLRPRAYGPHWRHGRSHSHGNPRERFAVVCQHPTAESVPFPHRLWSSHWRQTQPLLRSNRAGVWRLS